MRHLIFSLLLFSICLGGCLPRDPRYKNEVAPFYFEPWEPCEGGLILAQFPPDFDHNDCIIDNKLNAAEMIDIALRNNPLTKATWMQARSAAFFEGMQKSVLYPQIDLNETLTLNQTNTSGSAGSGAVVSGIANSLADANANNAINAANATGNTNNIGGIGGGGGAGAPGYSENLVSELSFNYLLLDFGGRFAAIESARQALIAANWFHNRNLQTVINAVLMNYYNYLNFVALVEAKEEDIKNAQENYNAAHARHEAGVGILLDVLLAESNLAQAKLQREQLVGQAKVYSGNLAHSMGLPADCDLKVEGLPKDLKLEKVKEGVECLVSAAKLMRPDLAQYYALMLQSQANLDVARSDGMPTVNLSGSIDYTSWKRQSELNGSNSQLVLELNVPLFHGFFYEYERKKAKADLGVAKANLDIKKNDIILDVVTAYTNFQTAVETYYFSEEYLKYAEKAYEIAYGTYKEGIATILDVLTAQAALSNARAQRIQAQSNWIIALANIAYATGRMTEEEKVKVCY